MSKKDIEHAEAFLRGEKVPYQFESSIEFNLHKSITSRNAEIRNLEKQVGEITYEICDYIEPFLSIIGLDLKDGVTVSWTQYTPYFNDGDNCEFSVNAEYLLWNSPDNLLEDQLARNPVTGVTIVERISNYLKDIPKEALRRVFGDGFEITISNKGIEVEEHSHD